LWPGCRTIGRVLERDFGHIEARRNRGLSLLKIGKLDEARARLIETARLAPDDVWTHLLLANSFAKSGTESTAENMEKALRFYHLAYAHGSEDTYVMTSFAGALAQTGKTARARELMEKANGIDPTYPNAAYGLALLAFNDGQFIKAHQILAELFHLPPRSDPRSESVYEAGWTLLVANNITGSPFSSSR
jgi:tetratricopeptide (TPR) repeat protein